MIVRCLACHSLKTGRVLATKANPNPNKAETHFKNRGAFDGLQKSLEMAAETISDNNDAAMPAPTALQRAPEALTENEEVAMAEAPIEEDAGVLLDPTASAPESASLPVQAAANEADTTMQIDEEGRPKFAPAKDTAAGISKVETRKIAVPPHRFSPLKNNWIQIYTRTLAQ